MKKVNLKNNYIEKDNSFVFAILLVFIIAFIPKAYAALKSFPYPIYDEIGTIAFPAHLAGRDWSEALQSTAYYGFGYAIIYTPLFAMIKEPIFLYTCICLTNALIQALCAVICYVVLKKFLFIHANTYICMVLSIMASFFHYARVFASNEDGLLIVNWLTVLNLCILIKTEQKATKRIISLLTILVPLYGMTMHTRAIILPAALVATEIFFFLYLKKRVFSRGTWVFFIVGYFGIKRYIHFVQDILWKRVGGELYNGKVASIDTDILPSVFDLTSWKTFLFIVFGEMNTINMITGTLLIVSLASFIYLLFKSCVSYRNSEEISLTTETELYVGVVFSLCSAGMVFGMVVQWWNGVYRGLLAAEKDIPSYKALTYTRYAYTYIGILLIIGSVLILSYQHDVQLCLIRWSTAISVFLQIFWIEFILPYVSGCGEALYEGYLPVIMKRPMTGGTNIEMYYKGGIVLFFSLLLLFLSFKYNRTGIYFCVLTVFVINQFMFCSVVHDPYYGQKNTHAARESFNIINSIFEDDIDKVYVINTLPTQTQYYFNKSSIMTGAPTELENAFLVYEGSIDDKELLHDVYKEKEKYIYIPLGANSYLFVKGEDYAKLLSNSDIDYNVKKLR